MEEAPNMKALPDTIECSIDLTLWRKIHCH